MMHAVGEFAAKRDAYSTQDQPQTASSRPTWAVTEVLQLMVAREYMRRYRSALARRVTWFGALRAIASSGAIAAWAVVRSCPSIWGGIIAASEVADALKEVFPVTARHKA